VLPDHVDLREEECHELGANVLYARTGYHVINSEVIMLASDVLPESVGSLNGTWYRGDMAMGAASGVYTPTTSVEVSGNATVTGELGAYYIGGWALLPPAHGSFVGITLQNQGAPQNGFMSTLNIEGGTWDLEHCEMRGAMNSVVAARFKSCVTARRCGIGGKNKKYFCS
jgi:hypothetical protein